jgi:hypothetical protein
MFLSTKETICFSHCGNKLMLLENFISLSANFYFYFKNFKMKKHTKLSKSKN